MSKKEKNYNLYPKDFAPTLPIPPGYSIPKEELNSFLSRPLSVEYKVINGITFVNYPLLFGESVLKSIWFSSKVLPELTNYHLYCIESFFADKPGYFQNMDIHVTDLEFPIKLFKNGHFINLT